VIVGAASAASRRCDMANALMSHLVY